MKKTIFIAILATASVPAFAQKIELGLNGGITLFDPVEYDLVQRKAMPGYYGSLRAALNLGKWQAGVGIEKFQTTTEYYIDKPKATVVQNFRYSSTAPFLFANRVWRLPKSYLYAGLNVGMSITRPNYTYGEIIKDTSYVPNTYYIAGGNYTYTGYFVGVQAGYTVNIGKHFGVNAETGVRWVSMESTPSGHFFSEIQLPVSLGVRYRL